jgi:hypothetical protein
MATATERLQSIYNTTLTKLEEAMASAAPDISVGGVSVSRHAYIQQLLKTLEELEKKPGVVPAVKPVFTITSVAR